MLVAFSEVRERFDFVTFSGGSIGEMPGRPLTFQCAVQPPSTGKARRRWSA
jgi:hypothetical protein